MKSEPDVFSIVHLVKIPNITEHREVVRNHQGRNMLRKQMKKADLVFYYHSKCAEPGTVGIMQR